MAKYYFCVASGNRCRDFYVVSFTAETQKVFHISRRLAASNPSDDIGEINDLIEKVRNKYHLLDIVPKKFNFGVYEESYYFQQDQRGDTVILENLPENCEAGERFIVTFDTIKNFMDRSISAPSKTSSRCLTISGEIRISRDPVAPDAVQTLFISVANHDLLSESIRAEKILEDQKNKMILEKASKSKIDL